LGLAVLGEDHAQGEGWIDSRIGSMSQEHGELYFGFAESGVPPFHGFLVDSVNKGFRVLGRSVHCWLVISVEVADRIT